MCELFSFHFVKLLKDNWGMAEQQSFTAMHCCTKYTISTSNTMHCLNLFVRVRHKGVQFSAVNSGLNCIVYSGLNCTVYSACQQMVLESIRHRCNKRTVFMMASKTNLECSIVQMFGTKTDRMQYWSVTVVYRLAHEPNRVYQSYLKSSPSTLCNALPMRYWLG